MLPISWLGLSLGGFCGHGYRFHSLSGDAHRALLFVLKILFSTHWRHHQERHLDKIHKILNRFQKNHYHQIYYDGINPQRLTRIKKCCLLRQPDLTVCMEHIHKPHNVSSVIRAADAAGIHGSHTVWSGHKMRTLTTCSTGSNRWVQVKTHRIAKALQSDIN